MNKRRKNFHEDKGRSFQSIFAPGLIMINKPVLFGL